jgi:hypothetical protein
MEKRCHDGKTLPPSDRVRFLMSIRKPNLKKWDFWEVFVNGPTQSRISVELRGSTPLDAPN